MSYIKLHKKALVTKYLVALILGLVILGFVLWVILRAQTENKTLLAMIKSFF